MRKRSLVGIVVALVFGLAAALAAGDAGPFTPGGTITSQPIQSVPFTPGGTITSQPIQSVPYPTPSGPVGHPRHHWRHTPHIR